MPKIMRMFDKVEKQVISESVIGSDVPVIDGDQAGYVYSRTEEEQAEIDRGFQKWDAYLQEHEERFWELYISFALEHWSTLHAEVSKQEYEDAYTKFGIPLLGPKATVSLYRKDYAPILSDEGKKGSFWRAANTRLYKHFADRGIEAWDVKKDIQLFGRERVRFFVLNLPIPEELESLRSHCIGELVKKENSDQAFLYRRIEQLSDRLEKANRRADRYQNEVGDLQGKLAAAYREIDCLKDVRVEVRQETGQSQKIERLKELITELKDVNKTLLSRLPAKDIREPASQMVEESAPPAVEPLDPARLVGKTVAFFGGWRRQIDKDYSCTIIFHDGRRHDPDFYAALRLADAYVIWTEFISHESMWEIKEWAAERDVPVAYLRGGNVERALDRLRI
jgi:hypothetical protein